MPKRIELIRYILILAALVGLVMFSWTLGHILRYSTQELWHPPIPRMNPEIEYGSEGHFSGIRREIVFTSVATVNTQATDDVQSMQVSILDGCLGSIYYTSMPAKCQTADGRLVQVGELESRITFPPLGD